MKSLGFVLVALLALASCGDGEPTAGPAVTPAVEPVEAPAADAPPPPVHDSPRALMEFVERLSDAAVAGRTEEALALARSLLLPEAGTWFEATFGATIGARLSREYAERARQIDTLPALFPELRARGQTELLIERHEDPKDPAATGYQSVAMANMKRPTRLYSVRFLEQYKDTGFSLWSFVHVDGAFRFVGKMRAVNTEKRTPHAAMLGELRRSDAEQFLETGKFPDDK